MKADRNTITIAWRMDFMKERLMAVTGRGTNAANKTNAVDGEKLKIRPKNRKLYVCGTVFP